MNEMNQLTNEDIHNAIVYIERLRELEYNEYIGTELYSKLMINKVLRKLKSVSE